jgi:hypothetical protein
MKKHDKSSEKYRYKRQAGRKKGLSGLVIKLQLLHNYHTLYNSLLFTVISKEHVPFEKLVTRYSSETVTYEIRLRILNNSSHSLPKKPVIRYFLLTA